MDVALSQIAPADGAGIARAAKLLRDPWISKEKISENKKREVRTQSCPAIWRLIEIL